MTCYICYNSDEHKDENLQESYRDDNGHIHSVCGCINNSGTVHASCLAQWIKTRKTDTCRQCNTKYKPEFFTNELDKLRVQNALLEITSSRRTSTNTNSIQNLRNRFHPISVSQTSEPRESVQQMLSNSNYEISEFKLSILDIFLLFCTIMAMIKISSKCNLQQKRVLLSYSICVIVLFMIFFKLQMTNII